jgi:hypothetical protein
MTAVPTITDAELFETLSLITTKMDWLRHRIAAHEQLTVSEAAQLAVAIEELSADTYLLADRLGAAGRGRGRPRAHARRYQRRGRRPHREAAAAPHAKEAAP